MSHPQLRLTEIWSRSCDHHTTKLRPVAEHVDADDPASPRPTFPAVAGAGPLKEPASVTVVITRLRGARSGPSPARTRPSAFVGKASR